MNLLTLFALEGDNVGRHALHDVLPVCERSGLWDLLVKLNFLWSLGWTLYSAVSLSKML